MDALLSAAVFCTCGDRQSLSINRTSTPFRLKSHTKPDRIRNRNGSGWQLRKISPRRARANEILSLTVSNRNRLANQRKAHIPDGRDGSGNVYLKRTASLEKSGRVKVNLTTFTPLIHSTVPGPPSNHSSCIPLILCKEL